MVRLTKIYTRTGDDGRTGLANGTRVPKSDSRVEAYGTTDEANAAIGLCVVACDRAQDAASSPTESPATDLGIIREIREVLRPIQHDLFDCGADLATPKAPTEQEGTALRIIQTQIDRLERTIDRFNERLRPLSSFVIPGGTPLAAHLHLARTIVRRAERAATIAMHEFPEQTSPLAVIYLNRLSDLLFVLGRVANADGQVDVLWKPGATRHE